MEHELRRSVRSLPRCSGVAQACSSLSFSIVGSIRLHRRLWQGVAHADVWSWAMVVVQLFGAFPGASEVDPPVEDVMLCCWRCRAVGLKAHALMLIMFVLLNLGIL